MENSIQIELIDDHAVFLAALRMLLGSQAGMEVVGEATTCNQALQIARCHRPDIILLDLAIGEENGLDYITELIAESAGGRVIILTGASDSKLHQQAIQQGALGVVLKTQAPEMLVKAIEKVHQGEAWIDRVTIGTVLAELARGRKEEPAPSELMIDQLTRREREVINLVAQGFKNKQIADSLHLSDITVRHHLTSVYNKLGVSDRFELIVFAYNHSLCELPKQGSPMQNRGVG